MSFREAGTRKTVCEYSLGSEIVRPVAITSHRSDSFLGWIWQEDHEKLTLKRKRKAPCRSAGKTALS